MNIDISDRDSGTRLQIAPMPERPTLVVDTVTTNFEKSAGVEIDQRTAVAIGWQLLKWGFGQFLKKNPKAKRAIDEYGPPKARRPIDEYGPPPDSDI